MKLFFLFATFISLKAFASDCHLLVHYEAKPGMKEDLDRHLLIEAKNRKDSQFAKADRTEIIEAKDLQECQKKAAIVCKMGPVRRKLVETNTVTVNFKNFNESTYICKDDDNPPIMVDFRAYESKEKKKIPVVKPKAHGAG